MICDVILPKNYVFDTLGRCIADMLQCLILKDVTLNFASVKKKFGVKERLGPG